MKKINNQIGTGVPVHPSSVPVHPAQKEAVAKVYRYTTNVYRYMLLVFRQKGFLTQNFVPFYMPNPPPLFTKPSPNLFSFSLKHPQVRLPLPGFPSLRPRFSCILLTDVVSYLKLLESIFVPSTTIHGLVWLV